MFSNMLRIVDVIPGALSSLRKSALDWVGLYGSDTVTEDMDQTMKLVKGKRLIWYEPTAIVYTEAPEDIENLYRQRKRWNSGTVMVMWKHRSHLWRHSALSLVGYPYLILSVFITPLIELITFLMTILYGLLGRWVGIALIGLQFLALEFTLSIIAIYLDKEDWGLLLYVPVYALLYRFLLDAYKIATYWEMYQKKIGWTRATRYGGLEKKIDIG